MFAGVEIGGTKIIAAVGTGPSDLSPAVRLPTTTPVANMAEIVDSLVLLQERHGRFDGIGVASFGPVGLGGASYGHILKTPKPGWSGADILGPIQAAFPGIPATLDTDVNGAGLAERCWGAATGLDDFAYVTIGTGIGTGIFSRGLPIHGRLHPEGGHVLVARRLGDDFTSGCPFHADCVEGLACGPTIRGRTGLGGEDLPEDHDVWRLIGDYHAQLYHALTLLASPQRIVIGGSVGLRGQVLAASRARLHDLLGDYLESLEDPATMDDYLRPAALGGSAGVLGAIALASGADGTTK